MTIAGLLIATFLSTTAWIEPPPDAPRVEQPVPPVKAKEKAKGDEAAWSIKSRITVGKDTTYFTEPIDKDGYVDYITALNNHLKKGVTPENNANVLFWKASGPKPAGQKVPAEHFKWLGIDEPPEKGDYFIGVDSVIMDREKDPKKINKKLIEFYELLDELGNRPWKAKDHPDVAEWLKANDKPLSIMVEGTKRSRYYMPLVPDRAPDGTGMLLAALVPSAQNCRGYAFALNLRVQLHLGEGRLDQAWQDLLACHRLGRLVAQGGTLIEFLVGISIDSIASKGDLSFIEHARPDTKQLKACLGDLERLPPMSSVADKVGLCERMVFIDAITMIQRKGPGGVTTLETLSGGGRDSKDKKGDDKASRVKAYFFAAALHWDMILRDANRWYDRMAADMRIQDRTERETKLKKFDTDLMKLKEFKVLSWETLGIAFSTDALSRKIGNIFISLLMPAIHKVQETGDRSEQIHRNLRVAFALAMYKNDEGRYPPKLNALAPRYLPQVPNDLFSGKELIYRPTDAGYLLYSVGVNGRDEEGRSSDDTPRGDDLPVRMPSRRSR